MLIEYRYLTIYIIAALIIVILLVLISILFVSKSSNEEKLSSYECGFNPFGDARSKFEVRFYLVGVLFIIFDLEITFLFPWILAISDISLIGIFSMLFFIFILTLGFIYEWNKGALDWE